MQNQKIPSLRKKCDSRQQYERLRWDISQKVEKL